MGIVVAIYISNGELNSHSQMLSKIPGSHIVKGVIYGFIQNLQLRIVR